LCNQQHNNHKASFLHADKANNTQLSKHTWNLKDNNTKFSLKWNILKICKSYPNITNRCNLCNYEKYVILNQPELSSLNKYKELSSMCKHKRKFLLAHLTDAS